MSDTFKCNPQLDVKNGTSNTIQVAKEPANTAPVGSGGSLNGGYGLALEVLSRDATKKTFDPGANGTVDTGAGAGATLNDLEVDIIAMSTANLFPAIAASETPQSCTGKTEKCQGDYNCYFPGTLEATATTQKAMNSALAFYKLLKAVPGTKNAQKFTSLITAVQNGTTDPLALPAQVDAFFKTMEAPYNDCTFDSFATVASYAENYAPLWANLEDTYTYTAYTPGDTSTPAKPAWNKIGTIKFTKKKAAELSDHDAGYEIAYADTSGASTALTMYNGQFVTKSDPDLSTIQLTGVFQVKSDLTLNTSDNVIIPVLTGSVGNVKVLAGALDAPDGAKPWYDFANTSWAKELLAVLGIIAAIAGFITLIYRLVTWLKSKTKKAKTKAEREKLKEDALDALAELIVDKKKSLKKAGIEDVDFPSDFEEYSDRIKGLQEKTLNNNATRQTQMLSDEVETQEDMIEKLGEFGVTNDLQRAQGSLLQARDNVAKIKDYGTLKGAKGDILITLDDSLSSIEDDIKVKKTQIGKELGETLERAKNTVREVRKSVNEAEQDGETTEEESEPILKD